MNRILRLVTSLVLTVVSFVAFAQPQLNTSWEASLLNQDVRAGENTQIVLKGTITEDWYLYGPQIQSYWVVTTAELSADNEAPVTVMGDNVWPLGKLYKTIDEEGNLDSAYAVIYENEVAFAIPVQINPDASGTYTLKVTVVSQACSTETGQCDPPFPVHLEIPLTVEPGEPRPEFADAMLSAPPQPEGYAPPAENVQATLENVEAALAGTLDDGTTGGENENTAGVVGTDETSAGIRQAQERGVLPFFILSLTAGLLALLTPCVWPMIPVTVSYFSKQSADGTRKTNLAQALAYGLGIIGTFVGLGLIATLIFGAAGAQTFAANIWVNIFLGLLFVALAMNLFGYYEIMVPTGFVNKMNAKARSGGGFVAPILLGFVFSLTTFTCTVPFVGTILFGATQGDLFFPVIGMLGFSLAFAVPFFFLALAPSAVNKLPKSGTWLNIVKATLGFIELAAGLKFISNAELTLSLQFLTYPVYMAIWVGIFAVCALFLFGIVKLPNSEGTEVGLGRKIAGTATVAFCFYLLMAINKPGILGSGIAFTPPIPYPGTQVASESGLQWRHTYEEALEIAQAENRPVFLNFTGVTCANCRVMERRFHDDERYIEALKPFVLAELYTDRNTTEDNNHAAIREKLASTSSNPAYVIVRPDGTVVDFYLGAALSAKAEDTFLAFLNRGFDSANTGAVASR